MGLSLLSRSAKPHLWPRIASQLSSSLLQVKLRWFNECVVAIDLGLFADKKVSVQVVNTDLGGSAAIAITAFQINCVESLISKHGYVSKDGVREFMDMICGRVS